MGVFYKQKFALEITALGLDMDTKVLGTLRCLMTCDQLPVYSPTTDSLHNGNTECLGQ